MSWWEIQTDAQAPPLSEGALHLWLMDLSTAHTRYESNLTHLNEPERARAQRFIPDAPRHQFAQARACLRTILGHYLGVKPVDVDIQKEHRGKPCLASSYTQGLRFNLSHSHMAATLVIGMSGNLGVDIEYHDPRRSIDALSRHAFAQNERDAVAHAQHPTEAFFRTWTRKEAYLKAMGQGLSIDLKSFEVDAQTQTPARLRRAEHPYATPKAWWIHGVELSQTYSLALAYDLPTPQQLVVLDATILE